LLTTTAWGPETKNLIEIKKKKKKKKLPKKAQATFKGGNKEGEGSDREG
jgi:RNase P/RNase MRP subunit p29